MDTIDMLRKLDEDIKAAKMMVEAIIDGPSHQFYKGVISQAIRSKEMLQEVMKKQNPHSV